MDVDEMMRNRKQAECDEGGGGVGEKSRVKVREKSRKISCLFKGSEASDVSAKRRAALTAIDEELNLKTNDEQQMLRPPARER